MTVIMDNKALELTYTTAIKYGCMSGCLDFEENGLTACNDCITEWQFYVDYYPESDGILQNKWRER